VKIHAPEPATWVIKQTKVGSGETYQMKDNAGKIKDNNKIRVLAVGLGQEESARLSAIFSRSEWPSCPGLEWNLEAAQSLRAAASAMGKEGLQIVVCEKDLGAASWREMLDQVRQQTDPPALIVASRMADEYLWAEALNLGAYDVLAAPFEPAEVMRVLSSACLHRIHRKELAASKAMRALTNRAAFVAASQAG
jgi:DNA-binding NtrC family response regulator